MGLSEASSTPGRLSPTTMSLVQEICVEPVVLPPTPVPATPKIQGEKRKRPEQKLLTSVLNEVTKEEDENKKRVRGEIRRSSASNQQQQATKENMGNVEEEGKSQESRTSSSTVSGMRVLKDSNLVLAKAQLSRPTMKKMSNNMLSQKEHKLYPLRSQSLSRRTRRGSRR